MKIWSSHLLDNLSSCLLNLKIQVTHRDSYPWPLRCRCSAVTNWATKSHSWEQVNLLGSCFPVKGMSYERNVIWSAVFEIKIIHKKCKHKSRIPSSIFDESRFSENSQIPDPVNILIVFPIPAPYFGQIPNPENTLPDPVFPTSRGELYVIIDIKFNYNHSPPKVLTVKWTPLDTFICIQHGECFSFSLELSIFLACN